MSQLNGGEERLQAEVAELKRQLEEQKRMAARPSGPSAATLAVLALLAIGLIVGGFLAGNAPRQRRDAALADEAKTASETLPAVTVVRVLRSEAKTRLTLPGNMQAIAEAPVLARASGYMKRRLVDIGDAVTEGQPLAEIEAPELDQQIRQAKAALEQVNSAAQQAEAALKQGQTNESLARVNAGRWRNMFEKKVVSSQENDAYQAQWAAQQANVEALGKAVAAAKSNIGVAQASLDRLSQLKSYQTVRAPFAGVVTLRNADAGALVNEGNTLLFRIAQTGRLRAFVNVPQSEAALVRKGQEAEITAPDLPGRKFKGVVAHTSDALDPATRTLLVEIQLDNSSRALMPGTFGQVALTVERASPSLTIRGDTLVVRADGPQTAVVDGGEVHFTRIQLGRDYGDRIEVLSGLEEGQMVVVNPSDLVREGAKVKPALLEEPAGKK
jgi:RND family efflux transporter MFP subunit